ncbi:MAG: tRNA glutamyl-Q(34) synthetase GluQRS [Phycisphaeraceae bacterium]
MTDSPTRITRLAPSPTGSLHLGNARTFLINWALARRGGWQVVLRIEDLDGPRVKAGASEQAIEVLSWLGMDWDGEPVWQSADPAPYQEALEALQAKELVYPCRCTRKEIQRAQSAPHDSEHELRYPGTCRPSDVAELAANAPRVDLEPSDTAWRLIVPDEGVTFHDEVLGGRTINVQRQVGDFVVASKNGAPAYQLAVVVDDARQGVTDVVRGDDLVRSTARQMWLYRLLDLAPRPRYWHLPLVLGPDGRRLAKRHGDTRLIHYKQAGVPAERVVGLIAWWSGASDDRREMGAAEFAQQFDIARLPREPVTFTEEDDAWLTA